MKRAWQHNGFRWALGTGRGRSGSLNRRSASPTRRRVATFEVLEGRWLLSTVVGMQGDGKTSVKYDPVTGAIAIQPDGNPVGLFDIQSASNIFTASAMFPPGGIIAVDTAAEKAWLGSTDGAFTTEFALGTIASPGLALDFLLNDLTLIGSGGLGTPNVEWDLVYLPIDYGDAPDPGPGTGPGNYNTRASDNGPRHPVVPGLRLGATVDGDSGTLQNAAANADDLTSALPDDEDGVSNPAADFVLTIGTHPMVNLRVTNTTGIPATLYGWIDYNANGVFESITERASVAVPSGTNNGIVTLVFPTVPAGFLGTTYARFRLSTDPAAGSPIGLAANGEVEDYRAMITRPGTGAANSAKTTKIANGTNGGPSLANGDMFGSAIAPIGDLDGDGVSDLAVGAPSQTGSGSGGALYVLFMNANGTVKSSQRIATGVGGGPTLAAGDYFGHSVAALGDLNGDGLADIAVGADKDDTGGYNRGAVYVLFMNANGTVKSSQKIAHNTAGGPSLANSDRFGSSVTSLGDLDGDGIADIAVGAVGDDTGGNYRGAVHVLFMNANGTVKSSQKIASGIGGGPALADVDVFGISAASLGDLDGDGLSDLAVGALFDDTGGPGRGAVHVLFMNANGTVRSSQKIASGTGGGPVLADGDYFGRSVAALGDLDGDGLRDLAVGAYRDDMGGTGRGALYVLLLNANGTVKQSSKIADGAGGGPPLVNDSRFGSAVAALGDLDGDGVTDLAAGAETDSTGGANRGALYALFLRAANTSPVFTSPTATNLPENTTSVMTVTAIDADLPPQTVTFSIAGGADQARFNITPGGALTFKTAPDFEAPSDANADNVYIVTVQASDGSGGTATQTINVTVTPVNDNVPVITSPDSVSIPENTTAIMTVMASDADLPPQSLTFSIIGGADQAKFNITAGGVLSFKSPPDFEAPGDTNGDNIFVVIVQASDGSLTTLQAVLVTVADVSELPDYNGNGIVDAADYVLWRNGGPLQNDPTPGVQPQDYDNWRANFGRTSGLAAASVLDDAPSGPAAQGPANEAASRIPPNGSAMVRQSLPAQSLTQSRARRRSEYRPAPHAPGFREKTSDEALVAGLARAPAAVSSSRDATPRNELATGLHRDEKSGQNIDALDEVFATLETARQPAGIAP